MGACVWLCDGLLLLLSAVSRAFALRFCDLGAPSPSARTPQMGWNSWNKFGCNVNETLIQQTADAMVSTGLAKLGYEYVNVDGQTQRQTDKIRSATSLN